MMKTPAFSQSQSDLNGESPDGFVEEHPSLSQVNKTPIKSL